MSEEHDEVKTPIRWETTCSNAIEFYDADDILLPISIMSDPGDISCKEELLAQLTVDAINDFCADRIKE